MENQTPQTNVPKQSLMLEQESTWFYIAVTGVIILVIFVAFSVGSAWIEVSNPAIFAQRIDAIYKIGIIGAGLVTFCTIAWRGLVSIRQVQAQVDATNNQTKQIAHTERTERAKLFQKGTELVESEDYSQRIAGIATLQFVALDMLEFSAQAFDIIAERIEKIGKESYNGREFRHVVSVFEATHKSTGFSSSINARFTAPSAHSPLRVVLGYDRARYTGGVIRGNTSSYRNMKKGSFEFRKTYFKKGRYDVVWTYFTECVFDSCKIDKYEPGFIDENQFSDCDFSGAMINISIDDELKGSNNYYHEENPPVDMNGEAVDSVWVLKHFKVVDASSYVS